MDASNAPPAALPATKPRTYTRGYVDGVRAAMDILESGDVIISPFLKAHLSFAEVIAAEEDRINAIFEKKS